MTNAIDIQWEEHSMLNECSDGADPQAFVRTLSEQFPGIAFRFDVYEGENWLHMDVSQPHTKKYDIRRWLRDNDMLNRYSDDDDDDRHHWSIPEDYQPAPQPESIRQPEPL